MLVQKAKGTVHARDSRQDGKSVDSLGWLGCMVEFEYCNATGNKNTSRTVHATAFAAYGHLSDHLLPPNPKPNPYGPDPNTAGALFAQISGVHKGPFLHCITSPPTTGCFTSKHTT